MWIQVGEEWETKVTYYFVWFMIIRGEFEFYTRFRDVVAFEL